MIIQEYSAWQRTKYKPWLINCDSIVSVITLYLRTNNTNKNTSTWHYVYLHLFVLLSTVTTTNVTKLSFRSQNTCFKNYSFIAYIYPSIERPCVQIVVFTYFHNLPSSSYRRSPRIVLDTLSMDHNASILILMSLQRRTQKFWKYVIYRFIFFLIIYIINMIFKWILLSKYFVYHKSISSVQSCNSPWFVLSMSS